MRLSVRTVLALLAMALVTGVANDASADGSISGRVTSSTTSLGLANGKVDFYDLNGNTEGPTTSAPTDASGNYTVNLPAGTYGVLTQNVHGYINKIYSNVPCSASCDVEALTPVVVTNAAITGIDFVLDPGGRIAGTVTDSSTGLPIANVRVFFTDSNAQVAFTSATTDASGNYISDGGTATGTVYAVTENSLGYRNEAYNNVLCDDCNPTEDGTPIAVTLGVTTNNINFALDQGGRISGTVRDINGAPLAGVTVRISDSSGFWINEVVTNGSGAYVTTGFAAGTYYAFTSNDLGLVDKVYNNIQCPGGGFCDVNGNGTPIVLTLGQTTSGIDFVLSPGGRFSGTVTNAIGGAPIPLDGQVAQVNISNPNGTFLTALGTDAFGVFTTPPLLPGTYFASVNNVNGFANQLFDHLPCSGFCNALSGTPIVVTAGVVTPNINFALSAGGSISGTLTNASNASPLGNTNVQLLSTTNAFVTSVNTNGSGNYLFTGVQPGSYYVRTNATSTLINQVYNGVTCVNCNVTTSGGTLVTVTSGVLTSGINFALATGGRISGTITNTATGLPIQNVSATIFTAANVRLGGFTTNASGVYTTSGLPAGTYFVATQNALGFINKLYNDLPCPLNSCNATTGTPVAVSVGATTNGIDFALATGGRISGTIVNAANSAPLSGVNAQVHNASGLSLGAVTTDASGNYITSGLPAGNYFVRTFNNLGYIDELYDGLPCAAGGCGVTGGTAVTVTGTATTTGVNFALEIGGRISGTITNSANGQPIANVTARIHNGAGTFLGTAFTNASGVYTSSGLPPGTHYVRTQNTAGFIDELYNDLPCPQGGCFVTVGAPIAVTSGTITTGIDFALSTGGRISGIITNANGGAPLGGISAQVFDAGGSFLGQVFNDAAGVYTTSGLPTGTYYVRTFNFSGFLDQLFSGIPCPNNCTVTSGTPITVTAPATTSGVNFSLSSGGAISGVVTKAAGGGPLPNVSVAINDAAGAFLFVVTSSPSGAYTTTGLAAGTYFVRTFNSLGYIDKLYDDITCLTCVVTSGTPVVVSSGVTHSGVDFALEVRPLRSRVDFDGDGRPDLTVFRPSNGLWSTRTSSSNYLSPGASFTLGASTDTPVPGDYDGDGIADVGVYQANGLWKIRLSTTSSIFTKAFGLNTDVPVPGDYDGDGRFDIAIFRPSESTWYYLSTFSGSQTPLSFALGASGDVPVPGDYDGDHKTDAAVYRPTTGAWIVRSSSTGDIRPTVILGGGGDRPVPMDYDGDGETDIAVFHPSGQWEIKLSSTGAIVTHDFGLNTDTPVPGDYDGDGKADVAIYRPSEGTWYALLSTDGSTAPRLLGQRGERPLSQLLPAPTNGDFTRARDVDGDRKADLTIFRPSEGTWYFLGSSENYTTPVSKVLGLPTDTAVTGDFDGDGRTDFGVYHRTGQWEVALTGSNTTTAANWGLKTDLPVPGDYDGDGKTDYAVFRPSNGTWFVLLSSTNLTTNTSQVWGVASDVPVPGDYDGDGLADYAVYRPSTGEWRVLLSSTNFASSLIQVWGGLTDTPVPGDYDGDGRTDLAVFHLSGQWEVLLSASNYTTTTAANFGLSTDVPVPGDYDGDGRTDYAVFRPSDGTWYRLLSSTNYTTTASQALGGLTDRAAPGPGFTRAAGKTDQTRQGDYDGDGKRDLAVYTPAGGWLSKRSSTGFTTTSLTPWGIATDTPAPGDYDGDGRTDFTVFRPSDATWYIRLSSTNFTTSRALVWGAATDRLVPGDYDGDSKTDVAVYHAGVWQILLSSTDFVTSDSVTLGIAGDIPVPGDYDGDGRTDIGVYRPSEGKWYLLTSNTDYLSGPTITLGSSTDVPVPGDYDGDGKTDVAVYHASGLWEARLSSTNFATSLSIPWGAGTDLPQPADYDGDGLVDFAVYRPSESKWYILLSTTNYTTSTGIVVGTSLDLPLPPRP